jgi:regulator of protease activity HflC (stomatin/prohibitin superfamily)
MADDETKALLRQILDFLPTLATKADVVAVDAKVDSVRVELKADMLAMEARLNAKIETEARVVSARLDEQRQTINAMIPTHIAAIPPQRQAS